MARTRSDTDGVRTWAALAGRLRISRALVFSWKEHPEFPAIGPPPWSASVVKTLEAWRKRTFRPKGVSEPRLRLILARLGKCSAEVDALRRDYVPVADVQAGSVRQLDAVVRTVDAGLGRGMPGFAGVDEQASEDRLGDVVRGILTTLADGPELVPVSAERRRELGARFGIALPAAEKIVEDDDADDGGGDEHPDRVRVAVEALARMRARKLGIETGIIKGELAPRAEAIDEFTRRAHAFRGALEGLPRSLAPRLVGLLDAEAGRIVQAEFERVLTETARRWFAV